MPRLSVNIDHVATVREARKSFEPEPVTAAMLAELGGAEGIICHLREDRRHIQDRDLLLLRKVVTSKLNLEMAATEEMIRIARDVRPDMVTLVPEKREELTTEGGLDVAGNFDSLSRAIAKLKKGDMAVSLFVDAAFHQITAAKEAGGDIVEIHTGRYADAPSEDEATERYEEVLNAARNASDLGLEVAIGHGLTYQNVKRFSGVPEIQEFSIGHSIIARAVMVGIERAVRDMIALIRG